jgi:hypothetical protein
MEIFAPFAKLFAMNQPGNYHHQLPKYETFSQPTVLRNLCYFIQSRIQKERDFIGPARCLIWLLHLASCLTVLENFEGLNATARLKSIRHLRDCEL